MLTTDKLVIYFLLDTFQILQITAIENEVNNRTVPAPFEKICWATKHGNFITSDDRNYMDPRSMQLIKFNNSNN